MKKHCKKCKYWENKQRELDYALDKGICVVWDSDIPYAIGVLVYDAFNSVKEECLDSDGTLKYHKREIVTHKKYGCRFFEKKDNEKIQ